MKQMKFLALSVIALALASGCVRGGLPNSIWAPLPLVQLVGDIDLPDGVFSGVGVGFGGNVYANVTIADRAIVNIEVTSHNETPAFAASVFGSLIPEIMARQATGVDATAGATETASALINAVEDALVTAGADLAALRAGPALPGLRSFIAGTYHASAQGYYGPVSVALTFDSTRILSITVTAHYDTPMFANMAFTPMIPAMIAAQDYAVDIVAGATYSASGLRNAVQIAISRAEAGIFAAPHDGLDNVRMYSGVGEGYYEDIWVAVILDGNTIIAIDVTEHHDTPMFANMAFSSMIPAMMATQSYNVDIVAGATYTSNAVREAVREALEQAGLL